MLPWWPGSHLEHWRVANVVLSQGRQSDSSGSRCTCRGNVLGPDVDLLDVDRKQVPFLSLSPSVMLSLFFLPPLHKAAGFLHLACVTPASLRLRFFLSLPAKAECEAIVPSRGIQLVPLLPPQRPLFPCGPGPPRFLQWELLSKWASISPPNVSISSVSSATKPIVISNGNLSFTITYYVHIVMYFPLAASENPS